MIQPHCQDKLVGGQSSKEKSEARGQGWDGAPEISLVFLQYQYLSAILSTFSDLYRKKKKEKVMISTLNSKIESMREFLEGARGALGGKFLATPGFVADLIIVSIGAFIFAITASSTPY